MFRAATEDELRVVKEVADEVSYVYHSFVVDVLTLAPAEARDFNYDDTS